MKEKREREREKQPPRRASSNLSSIQPFECQGRGSRDLFPTGFHVQNQKEKGRGGSGRGVSLVAKEKSALFSFPLSYWVRRGRVGGRRGGGKRERGEEKINTQTAKKYRGGDFFS